MSVSGNSEQATSSPCGCGYLAGLTAGLWRFGNRMSAKNGKTNGHKNGNGNGAKSKPASEESLKIELFWRAYLGDANGNGTEAARMAGFEGSDNTLGVIGHRLTRTREVRERIQARLDDALSLTPNEVIGVLTSHLRADVTEILTEGGHLDVDALRDRKLGHLIKKIKTRRYVEGTGENAKPVEVTEVELHDSFKAGVQLSRIMGIERAPVPADNEEQILQKATELVVQWTGFTAEQARELLQKAQSGLPDNGRVM